MDAALPKDYINFLMYQNFKSVLMGKMPDVHFIFEEKNGIVKLPAHKAILAASSKVFNVMFNGDLK